VLGLVVFGKDGHRNASRAAVAVFVIIAALHDGTVPTTASVHAGVVVGLFEHWRCASAGSRRGVTSHQKN
jgi:hypothetical protein